MTEYALAIGYALLLWWTATGLILFIVGLPRRTFRWTMVGATGALVAALVGLEWSSAQPTVAGAYVAFTSAVLAWAWVETSFLTGFLTGPRKVACPAGSRGWRRFRHAVEAILDHEFAIIGVAAAVVGLTWGGANQVGTWTFMVLWAMRQSAKLNLFFGVRNLGETLLPKHLRYLQSFFRRRLFNPFFPVAVVTATAVAAMIVGRAVAAKASAFEVAGLTLVAALLVLAIVEHLFLVLPVPLDGLWAWCRRRRDAASRALGQIR